MDITISCYILRHCFPLSLTFLHTTWFSQHHVSNVSSSFQTCSCYVQRKRCWWKELIIIIHSSWLIIHARKPVEKYSVSAWAIWSPRLNFSFINSFQGTLFIWTIMGTILDWRSIFFSRLETNLATVYSARVAFIKGKPSSPSTIIWLRSTLMMLLSAFLPMYAAQSRSWNEMYILRVLHRQND